MSHLEGRTLIEVRGEVLRKLGESTDIPTDHRIWGEAEIDGYLREGFKKFAFATHLFWDMRHLDDLPAVGNHVGVWEREFFGPDEEVLDLRTHSNEWERDWVGGAIPSHCTSIFERDNHLPEGIDRCPAVYEFPEELYSLERVMWDYRKIEMVRSPQLRQLDPYFTTDRGEVVGYMVDQDGARRLRKYRVPSSRADHYESIGRFGVVRASAPDSDGEVGDGTSVFTMHIDQWGIVVGGVLDQAPTIFGCFDPFATGAGVTLEVAELIALEEFDECEVIWRYGILKRLPGYFPAGEQMRGFVKKVSRDDHNTRIEFYRRPGEPNSQNDVFDLPEHMLRAIKHYALHKAFGRKGVGQDLRLSAHYKMRFQSVAVRTKTRAEMAQQSKVRRMGGPGPGPIGSRHPNAHSRHARLPRNLEE